MAGQDKISFKLNVRKLKTLGLTESLEVGYRLSPRGIALLDELRSHDVPFTDADANILVDIGDRNVARGVPDLNADDPEITGQVARAFPQYTAQQRTDVVRCLAEYVERTLAANRGTVPPDEDDHNG